MNNFYILLTAVLGLFGISIQFYFSLTRKLEQGYSVLYGINHYFSFFTVIINTSIAFLLLSYVLFPQSKLSLWFRETKNNSAMALYIFIVSLIYYTLLLNNRELQSLEIMATHILHGYVPSVFLLLWFFKFRKGDLKYTDSLRWVLLPLFYFIYILIRGALVDAYPYFFINVTKLGYGMVLLYALGILFVFLLSGLTLVAVDQKIKLRK